MSLHDPSYRALRAWLLVCMGAVILALVVGGITRLTESGLSITEWKPVSGVLPPRTDAEWQAAWDGYQQIPEAQTVHAGITLEQFKRLYWWEWFHRILARIAGLVIAVPYFLLLARGGIPRERRVLLGALPILVAGQGVLGWVMVRSGLTERSSVSQYLLVSHLALALVIYLVAAWVYYRLPRAPGEPAVTGRADRVAVLLAALVATTILSGGFVAGTDAGRIFNTFPLMGGRLVPPSYWELAPAWRNWFENPVAIQFNHRVLAMSVLLLIVAVWWWYGRGRGDEARRAWGWVVAAAVVQVTLGILTLLHAVPIPLAALHQVCAVVLLTAVVRVAALPR